MADDQTPEETLLAELQALMGLAGLTVQPELLACVQEHLCWVREAGAKAERERIVAELRERANVMSARTSPYEGIYWDAAGNMLCSEADRLEAQALKGEKP